MLLISNPQACPCDDKPLIYNIPRAGRWDPFINRLRRLNKTCSIVIGLLLLVITAGSDKFMFQGSVSDSADGRVTIHLNSSEQNIVPAKIRAFLTGVQQITKLLLKKICQWLRRAQRKSVRLHREEFLEHY